MSDAVPASDSTSPDPNPPSPPQTPSGPTRFRLHIDMDVILPNPDQADYVRGRIEKRLVEQDYLPRSVIELANVDGVYIRSFVPVEPG